MRTAWPTTTVSFALALGLAFGAIQLRSLATGIYGNVVDYEDRYYLPPPAWLEAFAVGYNEAAADILWTTTLVYFGGKKHWVGRGNDGSTLDIPKHTVNYISLVTHLDPKFEAAYKDGGRLTLYHLGGITKETVQMGIELLETGVKQFPDDGEIAFNLGFLHYYEMEPFLPRDDDDPTRRYHKEEGAKLIRLASTMDNAPPYTSILAGTLLRREGMDELVVEHLRAILLKETDPKIRQSLEAQLRRAMGKAAARDIEATKRLQNQWRKDLPHVSFDLFLLLQPNSDIGYEEIANPTEYEDRLLGLTGQ